MLFAPTVVVTSGVEPQLVGHDFLQVISTVYAHEVAFVKFNCAAWTTWPTPSNRATKKNRTIFFVFIAVVL